MSRSFCVFLFVLTLYFSSSIGRPRPVEKEEEDPQKKAEAEYLRYLGQVVEIMEQDEEFKKKLHNASEDDIRSGKIAEHFDLIGHQVRSKLDELKRREIEYQHQLLRKHNDNANGVDRQYWNPVHDENQVSFEAEDFAKLLHKMEYSKFRHCPKFGLSKLTNSKVISHNEMMEEHDKKRRDDFKKYELDKEHKRREELKKLDEKQRKKKEEEHKEEVEKHHKHPKMHEPGSKAELEEVWKEEDGLDPESFDPKTFFKLHDKNGDGHLDAYELQTFFLGDVNKAYNESDPSTDPRERDEELERMREHVLKEMDKNKDGLVSMDEFLKQTKDPDFEKDEEWKPIVDKDEYTEDEFNRYEKELEKEIQHNQDGVPHDVEPHQPEVHPEQPEEHHEDTKDARHQEKQQPQEHHDKKQQEQPHQPQQQPQH